MKDFMFILMLTYKVVTKILCVMCEVYKVQALLPGKSEFMINYNKLYFFPTVGLVLSIAFT